MKCSLGISNLLEEISRPSHSIAFLYFFALITEEGFLAISLLAILWHSAFKWVYLSFSPLLLASLLFTAVCKASSDSHFVFLRFLFFRMVSQVRRNFLLGRLYPGSLVADLDLEDQI